VKRENISPAKILYEIRRSVSEILNKPFTERIDHRIFQPDKRILALWAADCSERVLPYFTDLYPEDDRPRLAVEVLRKWIRDGEFKMSVIRSASLSAHAAAKGITESDAVFAAHAAGQAVAVPHVPTHAFGCSVYCVRAVIAHTGDPDAGLIIEKNWQINCLGKYAEQITVANSK